MSGRKLSPLARGILIGICLIAFFILLENFLNMASTVRKETVIKRNKNKFKKNMKKLKNIKKKFLLKSQLKKQ